MLKVGDQVRIRPDLRDDSYNGLHTTNSMVQLRGLMARIRKVDEIDKEYRIDVLINGNWQHDLFYWNDDMFYVPKSVRLNIF